MTPETPETALELLRELLPEMRGMALLSETAGEYAQRIEAILSREE